MRKNLWKRDHELDAKRMGELGTSEPKREQGIWERRDMKVVFKLRYTRGRHKPHHLRI